MKPTAHQNDQQSVVGSSANTQDLSTRLLNNKRKLAWLNKRIELESTPNKTFKLELVA